MKKSDWVVIVCCLVLFSSLAVVALWPDPPPPSRFDNPSGGGEVTPEDDSAVEPSTPPPPEGYPALPEGWEWEMCEEKEGRLYYKAEGHLDDAKAPFDGVVVSFVMLTTPPSFGICLSGLTPEGEPDYNQAVDIVILEATNLPFIGDLPIRIGESLPWVEGKEVAIYFAYHLQEEPEQIDRILDWLLGNNE